MAQVVDLVTGKVLEGVPVAELDQVLELDMAEELAQAQGLPLEQALARVVERVLKAG